MANQPINPNPGMKPPLGAKPIAPPSVPGAPGRVGGPPAPPMAGRIGAAPPPGIRPPAAPGQPALPEEEEDLGPQLSFWQLPWVQTILPFATSLVVHLGIVVVVVCMVVFVIKYPELKRMVLREPPLVAEAEMAEPEKQPGGVPFQGLGVDPLKQAAQDEDPTSKTQEWASKKGPSVDLADAGGGAGEGASGAIQVGAGASFGRGGGHGAGSGDGHGGGGDGGPQAMFGQPGGGGIGPKGPVFGNGGNAKRIAFVCDASGSMINKMPTLKDQLSKAFINLRPIQSFEMIFFQDNKYDSFMKSAHKEGLVPATPEAKRSASKFLEGVTTTGATDPIPGIVAAFKTNPDLIYLLTDGDFPDNDAVLKVIREQTKAHKVKINTIAFVGDGDNETAFLTLLETIAKETGGKFKHVKESDL